MLRDIAAEAGVSIRTVGRALKNDGYVSAEVRQRVEAAAAKLNYQPNRTARSLRTQRSFEVGLVAWTVDELHMAKISALEERLREAGYSLTILFSHGQAGGQASEASAKTVAALASLRPAAVAIIPWPGISKADMKAFAALGIPHIYLDFVGEERCDAIRIDRAQGVYDAVKYLANQGRRSIAYVGSKHNDTRLPGYLRAMEELGRKPRYTLLDLRIDDFYADGFRAAQAMVGAGDIPDAAQIYSDMLAAGFLAGLHSRGIKVPEQMAVVGFDDRAIASHCWPRLTTVAQPNREVGLAAAGALLQMIEGKAASAGGWNQSIATHLMIRETT